VACGLKYIAVYAFNELHYLTKRQVCWKFISIWAATAIHVLIIHHLYSLFVIVSIIPVIQKV